MDICNCQFKGVPQCDCSSSSSSDSSIFSDSEASSIMSEEEVVVETENNPMDQHISSVITSIDEHLRALERSNNSIRYLIKDIINGKEDILKSKDQRAKALKIQLKRIVGLNKSSENSLAKQRMALRQNIGRGPKKNGIKQFFHKMFIRSVLLLSFLGCEKRRR